jgi:hypothetical protein
MKKLSDPSRELSIRILRKVTFENRFIGYRLSERHGASRITSYSFQEVVSLLKDQMPRVDFLALQEWVRKVMGDEELAERISAAVKEETNDHDRAVSARNLMEERLAQCERMA